MARDATSGSGRPRPSIAPGPARRVEVVLLDALGTLVALEPPAPRLRAALAARGLEVPLAACAEAMDAEIAHYRAHHDTAGTPEGLAALRRACAHVVCTTLTTAKRGQTPFDGVGRGCKSGGSVAMLDVVSVEAALLEAIRFVAYPDTEAALRGLRALGLRIVVVSNWDVSLHEVLERLGLAALVDGALSSAEAGAAKPDPAIFRAALALAGGVDPAAAVHAGDSVAADVAGARAAGIAPVLVARRGGAGLRSAGARAPAPRGVPVVADLLGLVAHLS